MENLDIHQDFTGDSDLANYFAHLEDGELEVVVLLGEKDDAGAVSLGSLWGALQNIIAFKELPSGELVRGPGYLIWPVRDHKVRGIGDSMDSYGMVRARVRREKPNPRGAARFVILSLLPTADIPEDVVAEFNDIAAEYARPVEITRPAGTFSYDRRLDILEGRIPWAGGQAYGLVEIDAAESAISDPRTLEEEVGPGLDLLDRLVRDSATIDQRLRDFAAEEMLEEANEWREADEETNGDSLPVITPESFATRISLESVTVPSDADENLEFTYHDDEMFGGHGVTVTADRDGAPLEAGMS